MTDHTTTDPTTTDPTTTTLTGAPPTVWPCLTFADPRAAIDFLGAAFGLVPTAVYTGEGDDDRIHHAEMRWPDGSGGVMFGTAGRDDSPLRSHRPGTDAVYVVCSDPDALFARATAAGAEVVMDLHDTDYGSRDFTVRDLEGNLWSFGTYPGE